MKNNPLNIILKPNSIAFFGASNNVLTMGTNQLNNIIAGGFGGEIYPVHPKEKTVLGLKAYKNVQDIPAVPDVAVMVIPTKIVPQILEDCGKKGIKKAIIISGGFSEKGDEEGEKLQTEVVTIAKKYKIRFIGPNCIGVCSPYFKFNTTWFPYYNQPGNIGIISQSGTYACHIFNYLEKMDISLSYSISVGNEANIDIVDCIEFLGEDENTKVITLYLEGIRRGKEFIEMAKKVSKNKPILTLYVGGSEAGARACASHTAVLSGAEELYKGIFRQSGIIQVNGIEELFDCANVLLHQPPLKGSRIAIITTSGGPGASFADACNKYGLDIPILPAEVQEKLKKKIPYTGSSANPIDVTFTMEVIQLFFDVLPRLLFEEAQIDGLLIYGLFGIRLISAIMENPNAKVSKEMIEKAEETEFAMGLEFIKLIKKYQKPVIGCSFYSAKDDKLIGFLQKNGIPFLPSPERAVRALVSLYKYGKIKNNNY